MKAILFILTLFCFTNLYAQQDLSFGTNGHYNIDFNGNNDNITLQVAAKDSGYFYGSSDFSQKEAYIQKITPSGKVDSSFAGGLFVYQPINSYSVSFFDIQELSDGSYLVGGNLSIGPSQSYALVIKLNSQGVLDNSYNVDGRVTYAYNGAVTFGRKLFIDSNEKYWIAGVYETSQFVNRFFVSKFNQDGTPDSSFGMNAVLVKDVVDDQFEPFHFTRISNNNLLVLGRALGAIPGKMVALKFNTSGAFDTGFGIQGEKILSGFPFFSAFDAVLHNNYFYLAGSVEISTNLAKCAAVKTDTNFNADLTYGNNGIDSNFLSSANTTGFSGLEIDLADHLLFSGVHFESSGSEFLCIKKIMSSNTLDPTFGTNGVLQIKNNNSQFDYGNWSCLLNDQSLIIGGHYYLNGAGLSDITMCKILPQNSLVQNTNFQKLEGISVYPNPSQGVLYINAANEYDNLKIVLRNTFSQILIQQNFKSFNRSTIDLSAFSAGNYFLELKSGEQKSTFKIMRK